MKTAIFYGSATGTTEDVAKRIGRKMNISDADIYNVAKADPADVSQYDMLILGSSTWGSGDLEDDWYDFVAALAAMDLRGKKVAIFGCGDETMSSTFCDAVGELYDRLKDSGAEFIGEFTAEPYNFDESKAVRDDDKMAVGLLLDEVNRPEITDLRISQWCDKLKA